MYKCIGVVHWRDYLQKESVGIVYVNSEFELLHRVAVGYVSDVHPMLQLRIGSNNI
jgi:predicted GH43/DUF377 family glycosyl hydrolase